MSLRNLPDSNYFSTFFKVSTQSLFSFVSHNVFVAVQALFFFLCAYLSFDYELFNKNSKG